MMKLRLHNIGLQALLMGSVVSAYSCVSEVDSEIIQLVDEAKEISLSFSARPGFVESKAGRMTGEMTQQEYGTGMIDFRDIYQMKLFAFATSDVNAEDENMNRVFVPVTITNNSGSSIFTASLSEGIEKAGVASDVSLYVGTNHCLGYAVTNKRQFGDDLTTVDYEQRFAEGVTLTSWNKLKEDGSSANFDVIASRFRDFYFGPKSIYPVYPGSELETTVDARLLLGWLNRLMVVQGSKNSSEPQLITWGQVAKESLKGSAKILKSTYDDFVGNASGAYENMRSLLESIYHRLGEIKQGEDYFNLADNLRKHILLPDTDNSEIGDLKFEMQGPSGKEQILKLLSPQGYCFPRGIGLPDGAIILLFDETKQMFSLKNLDDQASMLADVGFDGMPIQSYSYPAEMIYRVNTPMKTSSTMETIEWGNAATWAAVVDRYKVLGVQPDSKSAVLQQPFEYLVSCLETRAYTQSDVLKDRDNQDIQVPQGGYPVTGVLVGMQRFVGWDGKVIQVPSNALPEMQYLAYDCTLHDAVNAKVDVNSQDRPLCYTLLLESSSVRKSDLADSQLGNAVGQQTKQMVVLELENTGAHFRGHDHMLITSGMRFYLVGELNLKTSYDKDKAEGGSLFADETKDYRIFEQGKRTQAILKISSLAGAYNCIPDLRNPSLQITLQTDWNWQNGLIYNDEITLP